MRIFRKLLYPQKYSVVYIWHVPTEEKQWRVYDFQGTSGVSQPCRLGKEELWPSGTPLDAGHGDKHPDHPHNRHHPWPQPPPRKNIYNSEYIIFTYQKWVWNNEKWIYFILSNTKWKIFNFFQFFFKYLKIRIQGIERVVKGWQRTAMGCLVGDRHAP